MSGNPFSQGAVEATPAIVRLPASHIGPFKVIVKKKVDELGSFESAAKFFGVSRGTLRNLLDRDHLTSKQGRLILAAQRNKKRGSPHGFQVQQRNQDRTLVDG